METRQAVHAVTERCSRGSGRGAFSPEHPRRASDRALRRLHLAHHRHTNCGFGRQKVNREIAFFKTTAIAQGTNLVRRELGLGETRVPAADPMLQTDIVLKTQGA